MWQQTISVKLYSPAQKLNFSHSNQIMRPSNVAACCQLSPASPTWCAAAASVVRACRQGMGRLSRDIRERVGEAVSSAGVICTAFWQGLEWHCEMRVLFYFCLVFPVVLSYLLTLWLLMTHVILLKQLCTVLLTTNSKRFYEIFGGNLCCDSNLLKSSFKLMQGCYTKLRSCSSQRVSKVCLFVWGGL